MTDSARNVVFARIGSRLRVAGMEEIGGYGIGIGERQIALLVASTRRLFPECSDFAQLSPCAGLWPATPAGLPIIGRQTGAPANLIFNVGHGVLGFTLAFGSAAWVAGLLQRGT